MDTSLSVEKSLSTEEANDHQSVLVNTETLDETKERVSQKVLNTEEITQQQSGMLNAAPELQLEEHNQNLRVERRTSSRLQKEILLTTGDKTLQMGKKRNLEGTNLNSENSFSVLANDDIIHLSKEMGITLNDSNYAAIDLIKDLEVARHSLAEKSVIVSVPSIIGETFLEVVDEELTDFENIVIHSQKRKGKPRNRLSLSGPRKNKKSKEKPHSKKSSGDGPGNLQ